MSEKQSLGGRELDTTYLPVVFEKDSGNVEAAIAQRTELFFTSVKKTSGLNHLAQHATEEANEWHEDIDIIPLEERGKKPVRLVHALRYYDVITVASVIQDHLVDGSVAVSFTRHIPSNIAHRAAYGEVEMIDGIITREAF